VPSFLRIQPWRFIISCDKKIIKNISEIVFEKSKHLGAGANILVSAASRIISGTPAVILIYNSEDLKKIQNKYKEVYANFGDIISRTELSAISAAIQNMILVAESLKVGSCWLDTPLFCKKEINKLLGINDELVAVLTLGYPAENVKRSPRKPLSETVKYIKWAKNMML